MPQALIWLDERENDKVVAYSKRWSLSKHLTIKKIIRLFREKEIERREID